MVVDDSITVRRVMERFLERNGLRVVTAKDGLDGISVLQEAKPDIILLDIEMPNMDGYEFATHVRNDSRVADVPIIMITSRVGDKHRARAIEIGVNDYLGKPYQDSQLLDAITAAPRRERDHTVVSAEDEELYSLLVPLVDERLIVPRACVAEVVRYTPPAQKATDSPWMLGHDQLERQGPAGHRVRGGHRQGSAATDRPHTGRRVPLSTTGNVRSGFFGMLTQGFPQLVRVNEEVLKFQSKDEGWSEDAPVLCRVKMINEFPLIPDLEALEGMIAEQTL